MTSPLHCWPIERDPAVIIDADDLAINKRVGFKAVACFGDKRKLLRKCIPLTGPECYLVGTFTDKAAIPVQFDS
jgi:hypothetical protein